MRERMGETVPERPGRRCRDTKPDGQHGVLAIVVLRADARGQPRVLHQFVQFRLWQRHIVVGDRTGKQLRRWGWRFVRRWRRRWGWRRLVISSAGDHSAHRARYVRKVSGI